MKLFESMCSFKKLYKILFLIKNNTFKQFVSFLLTISIENNNDELYKTVLLIDEPEVHLHPPAQISLLNELIKITSNDRNNLLFFATHSNYLIDKTNLDRYFKVFKHNNEYTKISHVGAMLESSRNSPAFNQTLQPLHTNC